jgi:hypothetical protein
MMGEEIFQAILDHPEGIWIGKIDPENNFAQLKTEDGRVNVYIPEMIEWLADVTPEREAQALQNREEYPMILMAGRHTSINANSLMRNPAWNEGKRACTLALHPRDGEKLGTKRRAAGSCHYRSRQRGNRSGNHHTGTSWYSYDPPWFWLGLSGRYLRNQCEQVNQKYPPGSFHGYPAAPLCTLSGGGSLR